MKDRKKLDNQGFSLVELMISIVILTIIMIPLLNNFITAAKINQKMKRIRSVEVTGQNLLESFKYSKIDTILSQFALSAEYGQIGLRDFNLLPLYDGTNYYASEVKRLDLTNSLGNYNYLGDLREKSSKGLYSFALFDLKIGKRGYDVLVQMNSKAYKEGTPGITEANAYNDYELPVLNHLDQKAVVLLDTQAVIEGKSCDELALETFQNRRQAYIDQLNVINSDRYQQYQKELSKQLASGEEITIVEPSYETVPPTLTDQEIKENVEKRFSITLLQSGENYRVVVNAVYHMDDSIVINDNPFDQTDQITIMNEIYKFPIQYLYLLYTPSEYKHVTESICITNQQGLTSEGVPINTNAYLIKQVQKEMSGSSVSLPYCMIKKENVEDSIAIYSNMKFEGNRNSESEFKLQGFIKDDVKGTIEKKEKEDFIYEIKVEIYDHKENWLDRFKQPIYSISSTGVEE